MGIELAVKRVLFWTAVCGTVLFLSPLLFTTIYASTVSQDIVPPEPDPGAWVINEIQADPADDLAGDANGDGLSHPQEDEFIELFNNTGETADISGWKLADGFGVRHQFPEGTVVPARCAIIVFGGGAPAGEFGNSLVQTASSGALGLDNSGDTITLRKDTIEIQSVSYGFEGNADQALTRNPDVEGAFEAHITATYPLNTRFSPGTRLNGDIFWGCPGYDAPPVVLDTQPSPDATAVDVDSGIAITFSEAVILTESWYEILCTASGEHTAQVSGAGDNYLLVSEEPFAYEETCLITLFSAGVSDTAGQSMEADFKWQFTTEAEEDQPPEIAASFPDNGVSGVPLSAILSVTFSEAVILSDKAVTLSCSDSGAIEVSVSGGPTLFQLQPEKEFRPGELCTLAVNGTEVSDQDLDDPPDEMTADWQIQFRTDVSSLMMINELDSETPGIDNAEFIELYDGGFGGSPLDGLAVVLFSGHNDSAYASFDLDGLQTDAQGFFLLGSESLPGVDLVMDDSLLQNGADAVALYRADAAAMPVGTAVTTENLIDALVYDTGQETDEGLLPLLLSGEQQVNENLRNVDDLHSLQRCPNGSGSQRQTSTYWPDWPTPKKANTCIKDDSPKVIETTPINGTTDALLDSTLTITFSEEVQFSENWFTITCEQSGIHGAEAHNEALVVSLKPLKPFAYGEKCHVTIDATQVSDQDRNDPPDHLDANYVWSFTTVPAQHILINEVDTDTPGIDTAEFIELYDGGLGNTSLNGLVIVLFNGSNALSYAALDLDGYQTNEEGYFLLGNSDIAGVNHIFTNGILQNGPDAIALFAADALDFPNGTAVSTSDLLDAFVYNTGDENPSAIMSLLLPGEEMVNEDGRGAKDTHSNQRCPNGSGGQRRTSSYLQNKPTPKKANFCIVDAAPRISAHMPSSNAQDIALNLSISVIFSEPVSLHDGSMKMLCTKSGNHSLTVSGGSTGYAATSETALQPGETCSIIVFGNKVSDLDDNDPPDFMIGDYAWSFETVPVPIARHIVINEVDADTEGIDTAEFIELYDGGSGDTNLDGLEILLFNGADDQVYRRIDLAGYKTSATGYFVLGGSAVPGVDLVLPSGTIQNGPDAVALYIREESADAPHQQERLLDAVVYLTNDEPDSGLQFLLLKEEPQLDEGAWRNPIIDSNQRCPNGLGGQRITSGYVQNLPTPGTDNRCQIDLPPQITQVRPADGALDVAVDSSLTVLFSEPVQTTESWIRLSCDEKEIIDLVTSGGPEQYTIQPASLAPFDSCKATVNKDKVFDLDGYSDSIGEDFSWEFATGKPLTGICGDEATAIHAVQRNVEASSFVDTTVIIEGVVAATYQGKESLNGFFLQEEPVDMDGDPLTSEGLFIVDGPNTDEVTKGDVLRIEGTVAELDGMTSLVNISSWQQCSAGTAVEPQSISLPLDAPLTWESLEGMLVTFDRKLAVIDSDRWGSKGIVNLASERLYYPTMFATPGPEAQMAGEANRQMLIALDDGMTIVNPLPYPPYLGPGNTLRLGDTVESLTGIVTEAGGSYRIQPTKSMTFKRDNPRPLLTPLVSGRMRVAHINTGGFFNGDGQGHGFRPGKGAQTAVEYERQRAKLVNAILEIDAAIIGLTGIENDGVDDGSTVQDLLAALNETAEEENVYQIVEAAGFEQEGFADSAVLIYRQSLVLPTGEPFTLADYPFDTLSRRLLGQHFISLISGQELIVVVTHFPERGNCPVEGNLNADQGDGQACWNLLRTEVADRLAEWVLQQQDESGVDVLVIGNVNSYAKEDPLQVLSKAGLINIDEQGSDEIQYSAIFNGEAGTLNYGLITAGLEAKVAYVQRWHINADEPPALDYHETNQPLLYTAEPYRSAAQDPLVIDLSPDELSAGFSSSSPVWIGQPAAFTNLSHGPQPLTCEWDFGDGAPSSTEANPVHFYERVGTYSVTLTVGTSWGETAEFSTEVEVLPVRFYFPIVSQSSTVNHLQQGAAQSMRGEVVGGEVLPNGR